MSEKATISEKPIHKFRYFMELAYDGTNYCGWQRQLNVPTVQQTLEDLLSRIYHTKITVMGCGRTDSGVHAKQYFAHINVPEKKDYLLKAMQGSLPKDIVVQRIFEVEADQHARFDASDRSYCYKIHNTRNPFDRFYSLYHPLNNLNKEAILEATEIFKSYENYLQLCKFNPDLKEHTSKVHIADWRELDSGNKVEFHVSANRFLHNQIRRMVGCLLDIGSGKISVTDLTNAMKNNIPLPYNTKVDPHGLFLWEVKYPFINS